MIAPQPNMSAKAMPPLWQHFSRPLKGDQERLRARLVRGCLEPLPARVGRGRGRASARAFARWRRGASPLMTLIPREAREGLMRAWLEILREQHPDVTWLPLEDASLMDDEKTDSASASPEAERLSLSTN